MNPAFIASLEAGITLFNQQEFYEAHEAWEAGWVDEVADERLLLQGLIQLSAGFYKLQTGGTKGAAKLLENGLIKLRPFVGRSLGVELPPLILAAEGWLATVRGMIAANRADFDPAQLPRIQYTRG